MITERDMQLQAMRPVIEASLDKDAEHSAGHFQHATLRPILKLQNDLLLQLFRHYLQKSKGSFFQLSRPKQLEFIAHSIRSDLRLRKLLTGVIVGHFTEAEWVVFAAQEQELTRRIADLLIQRLSDQVEKFMI